MPPECDHFFLARGMDPTARFFYMPRERKDAWGCETGKGLMQKKET